MSQQPPDDRKMDFSSLPRGAIGIKGLPIGRNTRLPSIRSPRDLTLGAPSKRTFMPNIPPRRDKKASPSESKSSAQKGENFNKPEKKNAFPQSDRGRGRGRGNPNIIQTQGSVFAEGIAENLLSRKDRTTAAYQKSDYTGTPKILSLKREQLGEKDIAGIGRKMSDLMRDDFIDDTADDDATLFKPTIFPPDFQAKKDETKSEAVVKTAPKPVVNFDPNVAKEMGFDVDQVARFIKKEKGTEVEEKKRPFMSTEVPENEITNLLNTDVPQLVLLQFPQCVTAPQKMDDSQFEPNNRGQSTTQDDKEAGSTSISSFPEGCVGKLQVFKSGKARLVLGGLNFDLDSINALKSKHEVVSIRTNSDSGDLTVLGCMEQKLKFVPDVKSLLS